MKFEDEDRKKKRPFRRWGGAGAELEAGWVTIGENYRDLDAPEAPVNAGCIARQGERRSDGKPRYARLCRRRCSIKLGAHDQGKQSSFCGGARGGC